MKTIKDNLINIVGETVYDRLEGQIEHLRMFIDGKVEWMRQFKNAKDIHHKLYAYEKFKVNGIRVKKQKAILRLMIFDIRENLLQQKISTHDYSKSALDYLHEGIERDDKIFQKKIWIKWSNELAEKNKNIGLELLKSGPK